MREIHSFSGKMRVVGKEARGKEWFWRKKKMKIYVKLGTWRLCPGQELWREPHRIKEKIQKNTCKTPPVVVIYTGTTAKGRFPSKKWGGPYKNPKNWVRRHAVALKREVAASWVC